MALLSEENVLLLVRLIVNNNYQHEGTRPSKEIFEMKYGCHILGFSAQDYPSYKNHRTDLRKNLCCTHADRTICVIFFRKWRNRNFSPSFTNIACTS